MRNTLQQLRPYEPGRERPGLLDIGGPLALDVPRRDATAGKRGGPPLEPRQLRAVLSLILEVRAGRRPPGQLRARVHPRLYRVLSESAKATKARYTLKTVHGCLVAPHAVEACGTVHGQGRAYALVARFERVPQGWHCTFFELIQPRARPR